MKPETPVSKLSRDLFGCNFSSSSDEDGQAKFKSIDDMLIDSSNESSSVASNNGHSDMHPTFTGIHKISPFAARPGDRPNLPRLKEVPPGPGKKMRGGQFIVCKVVVTLFARTDW